MKRVVGFDAAGRESGVEMDGGKGCRDGGLAVPLHEAVLGSRVRGGFFSICWRVRGRRVVSGTSTLGGCGRDEWSCWNRDGLQVVLGRLKRFEKEECVPLLRDAYITSKGRKSHVPELPSFPPSQIPKAILDLALY